MEFTKMHGLRNNYIFFNLLEYSLKSQDLAELSKKVPILTLNWIRWVGSKKLWQWIALYSQISI
ncbi:hypothetical protein KHA94_02300 [Bacillus sp. FJAT-49705]|uniref:Uncharacterized protein n=1 Tax=Cytobacillus citreus TaxID=2833586 RepID=A0ABS5NMM0_9BACI|nr:hypothetical protein [Cytobacillus citreus]MBS4189046.1 hypothetical protein [Cytobacillus citreus]